MERLECFQGTTRRGVGASSIPSTDPRKVLIMAAQLTPARTLLHTTLPVHTLRLSMHYVQPCLSVISRRILNISKSVGIPSFMLLCMFSVAPFYRLGFSPGLTLTDRHHQNELPEARRNALRQLQTNLS